MNIDENLLKYAICNRCINRYLNDSVIDWDITDVCTWITEIGFGIYSNVFDFHVIDGYTLLTLIDDDLLDIGIENRHHRLIIRDEIRLITIFHNWFENADDYYNL